VDRHHSGFGVCLGEQDLERLRFFMQRLGREYASRVKSLQAHFGLLVKSPATLNFERGNIPKFQRFVKLLVFLLKLGKAERGFLQFGLQIPLCSLYSGYLNTRLSLQFLTVCLAKCNSQALECSLLC